MAVDSGYTVRLMECSSQIGSGALPLETLPSAGISIAPIDRKRAGRRLDALTRAFRSLPVPVIGRVKDGALILDLRCLDDEAGFAVQLPQLAAHCGNGKGSDASA